MSADSERLILSITCEGQRYFVKVEGDPTPHGVARLRRHLEMIEQDLTEEVER